MNNLSFERFRRFCAAALLTLVSSCGLLHPVATPRPDLYSLDGAPRTAAQVAPLTAPILIVSSPHAAAGFDSSRIIYTRALHQLEYFAHSEWVDPPARMLAPLVVAAIEDTGAFHAVIAAPIAATGDMRLDIEIIRLQHEFASTPSRAHFTLRAYIVDNTTRRVRAWREFDASVPATSEDTYGGVVAANHAVQVVLEDLAAFCTTAAHSEQIRK